MLAGAAVVQTPVVIFLGDFYTPFPPFGVADAALLAPGVPPNMLTPL